MATQVGSRSLRSSFQLLRPGALTVALPLALVAGLTVAIRFPFFFWPLSVDEGSYAYAASWWFRGYELYSTELWFDRPQAIFLAFQAGLITLGDSTLAIRLWGALWAAATSVVLYLIARRLFDARSALLGTMLFAVFSAAPHIEGFTANAEVFMLLPATLSAYYLLIRRPAWAGFFASLALLLKPSGAVAIVFGLAWLLYERSNWRDWLRFLVAAAPLPLVSLGHAWLTVGVQPYLDAILWYRLGVNVATGYHPENSPLTGWLMTMPVWGPLAFPAILGLRGGTRRKTVFILLWCATSVAGVGMGGHWIMHYFQQVIPPLAVLAGAGLIALQRVRFLVLRLGGIAILALGICAFVIMEGPYWVASPEQGMWSLYHRSGYTVASQAAAYIRTHSAPDDTIYVAFYEAETYHLAQRRSSSIYLFRLDLLYLPGAYDSVVSMVEAREPVYVLDLRQSLGGDLDSERFYRALAQGYAVENSFDGVNLYRRR